MEAAMFCGFVFLMAMVAARLQLPHLCVLSALSLGSVAVRADHSSRNT